MSSAGSSVFFPDDFKSEGRSIEESDSIMSLSAPETRTRTRKYSDATNYSLDASTEIHDGHHMNARPLTCVSRTLMSIACLGGLLFGYDTGVISGAMILLASSRGDCEKYGGFGLNSFQQEVVVDATIGGAIIGAAVSGWASDRYGRRIVILASSIMFTAGSIIMAIATGLGILITGRVIVGLAIGLASSTVPVYLGECAPVEIRGRVLGSFNAFVVFGQILAALLDGAFFYIRDGWRIMLAFGAVFSTLQLIGLIVLPESPRWLYKQGRERDAVKVLKKLRGSENVRSDIREIRGALEDQASQLSLAQILRSPGITRALSLGMGIMALQQFAGINTVMYYSATIFKFAGFGSGDSICCCDKDVVPIWLALSTSIAQFIGILIGQRLSDSKGRRALLLSSALVASICLGLLGIGFMIQNVSKMFSMVLTIVGLVGYLVSFGWGLATLPWTLNGELYPMAARSQCASIATMTNWISNFVVSGSFLTLVHTPLRTQGTFWLLGLIAFSGFWWLFYRMPETKGKTLTEITSMFEALAAGAAIDCGLQDDDGYDQITSDYHRHRAPNVEPFFTLNSDIDRQQPSETK